MKKIFALLMIMAVILTGCKSSKDSINEVPSSKYNNIDISKTKVDLNYSYSNKPKVATRTMGNGKLNSLEDAPKWGPDLDLRMADMSSLDLTKDYDRLMNIVYDTSTKWPDKLPKFFDPKKILELGKNPGLGIRSLQTQGITGKGVNIAIIDYPPLLEHKEYGNQFKFYDEINVNDNEASMHGPFVSSLSVGKTCGVAPDASLYFIGCYNQSKSQDGKVYIDYIPYAKAIDKILDINKQLPKDRKIRALSISASWCPENVGYKEITEAVERAKKAGIFVISCNMFENYKFWPYSLDKEPTTDPDNPDSYIIYEWESYLDMVAHITGFVEYFEKTFTESFNSEMLLVPTGSRTYADRYGDDQYAFDRVGGWSAMEPYLAGLYAMACQVKPDITPDKFWKAALKTGELKEVTRDNKKYPARMLNPVKLIESLK